MWVRSTATNNQQALSSLGFFFIFYIRIVARKGGGSCSGVWL